MSTKRSRVKTHRMVYKYKKWDGMVENTLGEEEGERNCEQERGSRPVRSIGASRVQRAETGQR